MADAEMPEVPNVEDEPSWVSPLPHSTNMGIGIYLVIVGILGTIGNVIILTMFIRFRKLLNPTTYILISLAMADLGICIFGYPFSSSSSFAGRWLFGSGGCQWYAFMGFFFGSAHIGNLTLLAADRYFVASNGNMRAKMNSKRVYKMIAAAWVYALLWAVMPLFGWARYGPEPSMTTCTIDWRHNDWSYKSYLIVYFLFGFIIPLIIIAFCYAKATRKIQDKHGPPTFRGPWDKWATEKNVTWMCLVIVVAFVISWSPYAILCMWTVVADPSTVPMVLTLIPPLFAKASTVYNPIIYYFTNSRLRAGIISAICCSPEPREFNEENSPQKVPLSGNLSAGN